MIQQRSLSSRIPVLVLAASLVAAPTAPGQANAKAEVHILWIGNSLTYCNDLPKMLAELAKAGGQRPIVYEQETPGGCTLERHWNSGKALKMLNSRRWDFVVLQDHSQQPLKDSKPLFKYAKKFDAEVKEQGGRTLLYLPFPLAKAPENQAKLTELHRDLAAALAARVVPVGPAWAKVSAGDTPPKLFNDDGVHPTPTGSYLAACTFYAVIYGKSPEGLPGKIGGLTDVEARRLQAAAWTAVSPKLAVGSVFRGVTGQGNVEFELVVTKQDGAAFECDLKWSTQGKLGRAARGSGTHRGDRAEFVWHPSGIQFGPAGQDSWEHIGRFVDADTIVGRWSRQGGGGASGDFRLNRVQQPGRQAE